MFCSKGLPKVTDLFGYAPLRLIIQQRWNCCDGFVKGVLHYNRRDVLDWMLADENNFGYRRLECLCYDAITESRLDILREVFQRANEQQLRRLRNGDSHGDFNLCALAARDGKLESMKFLRKNECKWNTGTWFYAKEEGHEHILQYLGNNGYPTEWQY